MKIAIDARSLMNPPAGVGNYLITAANQIAENYNHCILYLLVNRDIDGEALGRLKPLRNIIIIKKPMKVFGRIGILWYLFKIYSLLKDLKPDFFWTPANVLPPIIPGGIRTVVTVQDFVVKSHAETMMLVDRLYYSIFLYWSIRRADILTTLSHYTKFEIERRIKNRKCKDIYVGVSIDERQFRRIDISEERKMILLEKFRLRDKFILFVGTIEPRKNLRFLVDLMSELAKHGFDLLIVGAKGWKNTGIHETMNTAGFPVNNVVFSGFVSTDNLVEFYNMASLLVIPSINEGFGLPALEAMACGCPVVAAANSGLKEVVQGGGKLVTGWKKEDWINAIIETYENRGAYVKMGFSRWRDYLHHTRIDNIIEIFKQMVNK